eukprot:GILK01000753.1.p1 GENE.GILK01000753.1~~GILK01000753.1.p1  ORF type:complete len:460 (+),score=21.87 GILK01000753.1:165-1544(+)
MDERAFIIAHVGILEFAAPVMVSEVLALIEGSIALQNKSTGCIHTLGHSIFAGTYEVLFRKVGVTVHIPVPSIVASPSTCRSEQLSDRRIPGAVTAHPLVLITTLDLFSQINGNEVSPAASQLAVNLFDLLRRVDRGQDHCGPFTVKSVSEPELTPLLAVLVHNYFASQSLGSSSSSSSSAPSPVPPTTFCCCHQGPAVGRNAAVDLLIYAVQPQLLLPTVFIVVSIDGDCARKVTQAAAYAVNLARHMRLRQSEPLLILGVILCCSHTKFDYEVHAYVGYLEGGGQKLLDILLQSKTVRRPEEFSRLFDCLSRWSHHRIQNIANIDSARLPVNNALIMDGYVFKSFGNGDAQSAGRRPDYNLKYIPGATLVIEGYLDNISLLKYPFIEGTHVASSVEQFLPLLSILHDVHNNGVVHGDIRHVTPLGSALMSMTERDTKMSNHQHQCVMCTIILLSRTS